MKRQFIAIDLKSFYASVECNERGLDPLTTRLVVADASRTEMPLSFMKTCGFRSTARGVLQNWAWNFVCQLPGRIPFSAMRSQTICPALCLVFL